MQTSNQIHPLTHKAGFINIIGRPNVGKSTLSNSLVGERLSIISSKAQTTRHRILGIINGKDYQIVISDTPGFIQDPGYKLHKAMNKFVSSAIVDADVLLFVTDIYEKYEEDDELLKKISSLNIPLILVVNKIDQDFNNTADSIVTDLSKRINPLKTIKISALDGDQVPDLIECIHKLLPEFPPYFPKDALTDKPERFFISEIIREKIFSNYRQEIPYSCEVVINSFKDRGDIIAIEAYIFVNRKTQKPILIGRNASRIKKVGTEARIDIEKFVSKRVFLDLHVKVKEDWREKDFLLKQFGYKG